MLRLGLWLKTRFIAMSMVSWSGILVIEEIISETSKFEKLNEVPTLKRKDSLQRFSRKLKRKKLFK